MRFLPTIEQALLFALCLRPNRSELAHQKGVKIQPDRAKKVSRPSRTPMRGVILMLSLCVWPQN
jgi:hypothetical protein